MKLADSKIQPRALVVGAGTTGRELLRRLTAVWLVSIVDIDSARLDLIDAQVDTERVQKTVGDGTSRLILAEAGIEHVDYVIAVSDSDDVNLEVCRLARDHFGKSNLFAAVSRFSERERYRKAGIDFVTPSYAAAVNLQHRVLHGVGTSLSIAEAHGEIVEVSVLPSSPMIGRTLSSIRSQRWHVASIFRNDMLVVPTGAVDIQVDDRVILVGEREILPSIAEFFRLGEPEFPLEFGSKVLLLTESAADFRDIASELRYVMDHSRARGLEILFWPHEPEIQTTLDQTCSEHGIEASSLAVFGNYGEVGTKHVLKKDCGFLIVPDERFRFLERLGLRRTMLWGILGKMEAPFAILRGSQPYKRILLPVTHDNPSMEAARLAFDLARIYKAGVTVVTVTPPRFAGGEKALGEQKSALDQITHLAILYRLEVERIHLEGNPVDRILVLAADYDLLLLSQSRDRRPSLFNPDVSQHLFRRSPITTITLPV